MVSSSFPQQSCLTRGPRGRPLLFCSGSSEISSQNTGSTFDFLKTPNRLYSPDCCPTCVLKSYTSSTLFNHVHPFSACPAVSPYPTLPSFQAIWKTWRTWTTRGSRNSAHRDSHQASFVERSSCNSWVMCSMTWDQKWIMANHNEGGEHSPRFEKKGSLQQPNKKITNGKCLK